MMRVIRLTVFSFVFVSLFCLPASGEETQTVKYLGEKLVCLVLSKIDETKVLDDQTLLIETDSGVVYINRLPSTCVGLRAAGAFSYKTSISKLCKHDIIKVLEEDGNFGSVCGLGKFIRIKGVRSIRETVKLLKSGVLDNLIKEGAFNTGLFSETAG